MDLTEEALGLMTPRTFSNKIKGNRNREMIMQIHQRNCAAYAAAGMGGKVNPKDIISIPEIDGADKSDERLTDEEAIAKLGRTIG